MAAKPIARPRSVTRGVVAARTGINIETIRYYERIGLLPAPPRSAGGHRIYGETLIRRLDFIRRSRDLGFTLDEVRNLLRLVDGGGYSCAEVKAMTLGHLETVRAKIGDLAIIEDTLAQMAALCDGDDVPECPVIDALFDGRAPVR
jgi:MerR family transcriptional regulator, mercuric resistance operon regulatory protein